MKLETTLRLLNTSEVCKFCILGKHQRSDTIVASKNVLETVVHPLRATGEMASRLVDPQEDSFTAQLQGFLTISMLKARW
ncbi:hypothetical protein RC74_11540 [Falsihalocynthiibacter arcticus]|uniref:Uncharacterized protein n=1 Tax=Falsihalocynthiibacter arcticus TaxID=1579316 RepID=A0A126V0J7_9RHOB|nr:hypothetical protein RC74_11540 [Falsihalocynthiibacter arcticus]